MPDKLDSERFVQWDAVIRVVFFMGDIESLKVCVAYPMKPTLQQFLDLGRFGVLTVTENQTGFFVNPNPCFDTLRLAEAIAGEIEEAGYKTKREIETDDGDRPPVRKSVQSFLLV